MKKRIFGVFCCILIAFLIFFFNNEELKNSLFHPSGYKVHDWEADTEKTYVTIEADCILNQWYENISYEQYQEMERLFAKDRWQIIDDLNYNEHDASVAIRIGDASDYQNYREFLIYNDDTVKVFQKNAYYQMPIGTCEKLEAYLKQYYQKQHDTAVKLDAFLPDFFAAEYDAYWRHDYGKVLYIQNDEWEISADDMFCPGSPEMSEEILALLADRSQWEEIPFDMNLYLGTNQPTPISFQCESLYGDDYYIDFRQLDNGRTHVAVNTYAAFLAPGELYGQIEAIFDHYEDDWEVCPLEE